MAGEETGVLVRQALEAIWNQGALEVADVLFAPDYVNHGGLIPDLMRGPEAIKLSVALLSSITKSGSGALRINGSTWDHEVSIPLGRGR